MPLDEALRRELLTMRGEDQRCRTEAGRRPRQMKEADARNTARLREIVDRHGWPGASLVGADGADAAWLIAQHADHDPAFQRRCLDLMLAADPDEVGRAHVAYLTDRVLVGAGRPQIYGTQVDAPIEDPARVDERRAAVGLGPLAEYLRQVRGERLPEPWRGIRKPSAN